MARNANGEYVIIDAEILDCVICNDRLKSPIIQCENGHYVCNVCKHKIQNKCPICRKRIDNIRCLVIDKILESAKPWPNPYSTSEPEVIELSDDESDNRAEPIYNPNVRMWYYEYPLGKLYGPFSLQQLKVWNDEEYFVDIPNFRVFQNGGSLETGVLLSSLLQQMNTLS